MSGLDDMKKQFGEKLDKKQAEHEAKVQVDLAALRDSLKGVSLPAAAVAAQAGQAQPASVRPPDRPLVNLTGSKNLQEIDAAFVQTFNLGKYYPRNPLNYLTVLCDSLEEFYKPGLAQMDLSAETRQAALKQMVRQAETQFKEKGEMVLGYCLPGQGAYLNGWVLRQAYQPPELSRKIVSTAIHEKLGHGFLQSYSALGQVNTRMGMDRIEIARRFGMQSADDPLTSLRREQANLLTQTSQYLEEGWATWLETSLGVAVGAQDSHPRYQLQQVAGTIQILIKKITDPEMVQSLSIILEILAFLFGPEVLMLEDLLKAVVALQRIGGALGEVFGQPLRYVLGDLVFVQAEANLGPACVPYAALIAANVTFEPASMGLADLHDRLTRDPRLNPDARMAAISRLRLKQKNSVPVLVQQVRDNLSFSIPAELK